MLGEFKYKDVKIAINCTTKKYDGKSINDFPHIQIGYYHPSNANWSYQFYVIDNGRWLETVVATFGHIIAKGDF